MPLHWRSRFFAWLRENPSGLVVLAVLIGAGAGLGAIAFRFLILQFTRLFTGVDDPTAVSNPHNPMLPQLGIFFVLLVPVIGGLIYGLLVTKFAREARGHGVPEVMLAVAQNNGRIRPRVSLVKAVASAVCIGSGGSVGREGPIVQIGSSLGSTLGQVLRVPDTRMRILVACGAAGGISATFNAPIAGVFFALELILGDFAAQSFAVVVLASVTADVVGRAAFGGQPFLTLPAFQIVSLYEYGLYVVLGVVAGLGGMAFVRVLYAMEDIADRVWRGPEWLRPAVGGLLLGALLLVMPELYGVGYPVIHHAITGGYLFMMLIGLMAGKMLATSLTIAIGGSGGVFAPSLFVGAMLGSALGVVAQSIFGSGVAPPGAYGIVGMGAVFAGAARAPITAVIIIFELTDDYTIMLPLMTAVVIAAGLSNLLTRDTIYTLKLRRRGIDLHAKRASYLMELIRTGEAMRPVPNPLHPNTSFAEVTTRMIDEKRDALPVVDEAGVYRGLVTTPQIDQAMRDGDTELTAAALMIEVAPVHENATLQDAVASLLSQSPGGLPVINDGRLLVGWLSHADVLRAYHRRWQVTTNNAVPARRVPANFDTATVKST